MNFQDQVYAIVKKIPKGEVLTYKQVAQMLGNPKSYRAVGNILHRNTDPLVPCHRVIRSDGITGGYNMGAETKIKKLREEGYLK